jgi:hypothetical protein
VNDLRPVIVDLPTGHKIYTKVRAASAKDRDVPYLAFVSISRYCGLKGNGQAMLVKGDLKCLHCGHVSGAWMGARGGPLVAAGFQASGAEAQSLDPAEIVHCSRCHGPVFLDDAAPVMTAHRLKRIQRLRAQIAAIDARKGRAA